MDLNSNRHNYGVLKSRGIDMLKFHGFLETELSLSQISHWVFRGIDSQAEDDGLEVV